MNHEDHHPNDTLTLAPNADLETVLAAWHGATVRLEQTHEALRAEVQRLTDELEIKNRELARKNRLADLGQMASHVAHEVRNSLVPVTLYLSMLRRRLTEDRGSLDVLEKIESSFTALDVTVNDLLHFTSDREPKRVIVSPGTVAEEICVSLGPQLAAQSIDIDLQVTDSPAVLADQDMLRRAILNLVLNALDVMPQGGVLRIVTESSGDQVLLRVADTGPGLDTATKARIFEPFFSTKHNGTGLGLAIVYRVAEVHGARIEVADAAPRGAVFTLTFPRAAREVAA